MDSLCNGNMSQAEEIKSIISNIVYPSKTGKVERRKLLKKLRMGEVKEESLTKSFHCYRELYCSSSSDRAFVLMQQIRFCSGKIVFSTQLLACVRASHLWELAT